MLDPKEHYGLSWEDTVLIFEKKKLNVPAEIMSYVFFIYDKSSNFKLILDNIYDGAPSALKYKEDIDKYLLLM